MKNITFRKGNVVVSFQFSTTNTKTGDLVQSYIFPASWLLTDAKISTLDDSDSCFDCIHGRNKEKTCYVQKGTASWGLSSKVKSLRKLGLDNIPYLSSDIEAKLIQGVAGRGLRFGSFGEPILLGEQLVSKLAKSASMWTGYTQRWHVEKWASKYFMASVTTEALAEASHKLGFRSFFVGATDSKNFVTCPASKEAGRRSTCDSCRLCMGSSSKAKSIKILPH
jgi:hypothetical protein